MSDFPTMSPIFGVLFALAGLALAVILGMALYKDERQEPASAKQSLKVRGEAETV
jgi:hypothetical protein